MDDACRESLESMAWVANGSASSRERIVLHRHIAGCDSCRREFIGLLVLRRRLERLAQELPPCGVGVPPMAALSRLVPLLEALGVPRLAVGLLRLAADVTRAGVPLRVPFVGLLRT
jgi:hypothetical protein